MTAPARHLPLRGAYNIRDLGGYPTGAGGITPWRRFLRADSLHRLEDGEAERLMAEGLRSVIDLRTPTEMAGAPNPFASVAEVDFTNMPLFDDLSPEALAQHSAAQAHPLLGFYIVALETRGAAITEILSEMAKLEQGAVLFNCTAGKDRTGLIAALLLGLAEVPRENIIADYTLTAKLIPDLVAEFLALSRARGGDVESYARLLESPAPTMADVLDRIGMRHGTVAGFLRDAGMDKGALATLQDRLMRGAS